MHGCVRELPRVRRRRCGGSRRGCGGVLFRVCIRGGCRARAYGLFRAYAREIRLPCPFEVDRPRTCGDVIKARRLCDRGSVIQARLPRTRGGIIKTRLPRARRSDRVDKVGRTHSGHACRLHRSCFRWVTRRIVRRITRGIARRITRSSSGGGGGKSVSGRDSRYICGSMPSGTCRVSSSISRLPMTLDIRLVSIISL